MACMEHSCLDCGKSFFNNENGPNVCPECGSTKMRHYFDEELDYGDSDDDVYDHDNADEID